MASRRTPKIVQNSKAQAVDVNGVPLYGMDLDLARKAAAKFDPKLEAEAIAFLEGVTGEQLAGSLAEWLHDGQVLCRAINTIKPGSVRRINNSKMPFKQMENISNFTKSCRALGLHECDLFTTVSLFEAKDMNAVISGIVGLGRLAQKLGFAGATMGPKEATSNKRTFTEKQLRGGGGVSKLNMGSAGIMQKPTMDTSRNIAFGAEQSGKGGYKASAGMSKLNQGSSATMQRSAVDSSNSISFGADKSGAATAGMSRLNMGSAGIMQKPSMDTSRNITFGAEKSGASAAGMTRMMMGSAGVMDRSAVSRANDITFGSGAGGGKATSGTTSRWNQGSAGVMQRTKMDNPNNRPYRG